MTISTIDQFKIDEARNAHLEEANGATREFFFISLPCQNLIIDSWTYCDIEDEDGIQAAVIQLAKVGGQAGDPVSLYEGDRETIQFYEARNSADAHAIIMALVAEHTKTLDLTA